jgi:hypothetical protein
VFPYIGAQLLLAMAVVVLGGGLVGVLGLANQPALAALGMVIVGVLALGAYVRTSLVAPVVAVERVHNPIKALQRSWAITRAISGA